MNENKRILIVDDNNSIHEDFRKVLCPEQSDAHAELSDLEDELFESNDKKSSHANKSQVVYEVDSACQGQDALKMVQKAHDDERPYALVFMDVRMPPGWDGIETIMRIWVKYPYTEIVLCTAYSDYTWDEIISKLGSTDKLLFLRKPFDPIAVQQMAMSLVKKWSLSEQARLHVKNLEREVKERTRQLEILLTEMELKNKQLADINKELEHVALHDSLTKLPNRFLFSDRLQHIIKMASRNNQSFAVFLLDLDNFKQINDSLGHLVGDKVLYEIGERLALLLRASDTVARLGGDEFALITPSVTDETSLVVANKIIKALQPPIEAADNSIYSSASIGIAMFPDHGKDEVTLMKCADIAMYQAKETGSGFAVFNAKENAKKLAYAQLAIDLKDAICNGGLSLHYQPIIDITTGKVHAAEALARWKHPQRGFIFPDRFIPLAEQKGLIQPLTLCVFDIAFRQCAEWHKMGVMIHIAINISTRNLMDPRFPEEIDKFLGKWNLDHEWVILEVTESMTMSNPDQALGILNRLSGMGLRISIDDFGTGFSSLSYLNKFPIEELKIDKSFVLRMDKDNDNKVVVQSTIDLAHALGLKVVAEGVEDENIVNLLKSFSCDMMQGFHVCRPQPAEDISRWFLKAETIGK